MEAPKAPVALEALYVAEESYGARPVSGFADAPGRRDDIVAYADDSNLVTQGTMSQCSNTPEHPFPSSPFVFSLQPSYYVG
jgi:hypothetical protein